MNSAYRKSLERKLPILVTIIAVTLTSCTFHSKLAQQQKVEKSTPGIDLSAFSRNLRIAEELATDDKIAWISTDSILAEKISLLDSLDGTWFVCKTNSRRYAYYGRYSTEESPTVVS